MRSKPKSRVLSFISSQEGLKPGEQTEIRYLQNVAVSYDFKHSQIRKIKATSPSYSGAKNKPDKPHFPYKIGIFKRLFRTKKLENCLILLTVKQHIQDEHKLKFGLKNNHLYQNCAREDQFLLLLLTKT